MFNDGIFLPILKQCYGNRKEGTELALRQFLNFGLKASPLNQYIQKHFLEKVTPDISAFTNIFRIFLLFVPDDFSDTLAQSIPHGNRILFPPVQPCFFIYSNQCPECSHNRIKDPLWTRYFTFVCWNMVCPTNSPLLYLAYFFVP